MLKKIEIIKQHPIQDNNNITIIKILILLKLKIIKIK